jgi:hypothetical protein
LGNEREFHYAVSRNLAKLKEFLDKYDISKHDEQTVLERIDLLQEMAEEQPKTLW